VDPVPGQQVDDAVDSLAAVVLPVPHGLPGVLLELLVVGVELVAGELVEGELELSHRHALAPQLEVLREARGKQHLPGPRADHPDAGRWDPPVRLPLRERRLGGGVEVTVDGELPRRRQEPVQVALHLLDPGISVARLEGALEGTVPWTGKNPVPWCACEIRRSQVTRTYIWGASLWALVDPNRGHAPPRRWPYVAWSRLSSA
jgi:hypothetical protein